MLLTYALDAGKRIRYSRRGHRESVAFSDRIDTVILGRFTIPAVILA
jgi:hypothetical protein